MLLLPLLVVIEALLVLVVNFQRVSLVCIRAVAIVEQLRLLRRSVGAFQSKRIIGKQMSLVAVCLF
jgi:hypothetical protein